MLRFADLNPLGRTIIIIVAVLTLGVAAVAFATSYGALYALVRDTGLYSERLARAYPLLLDCAFIVAELAAILGGILRGPRGWPITVMLITGTLTIAFNLMHAMDHVSDWTRGLIAALPPILMILSFQIDLTIVAWVLRALGRTERVFGSSEFSAGPPPGLLGGTYPHSMLHPGWRERSEASAAFGQFGPPWPGGGAGTTKRQQIESYLDHLGPDKALTLGARGVTNDLRRYGVDVSERYVKQAMDARAGAPSSNGRIPGAE